MRSTLTLLAIVAAAGAMLAAVWIFRGQQISSLIHRYWTVETQSTLIQSIGYEGSGTAAF
jgi:hypothetical protein